MRLFIFMFLPVCVINSDIGTRAHLQQMAAPSSFDNAGVFCHHYLSAADRKSLTIAGTGLSQLMRAKFHVDNPDVVLAELAPGAPVDMTHVPFNAKWLLVVGDHSLPPGLKPDIATGEYALIRIQSGYLPIGSAKFTDPLPNGILAGADGLSGIEMWGRWSIGSQITLHFNSVLPKALYVVLNAQAFGPNVGQNFTLRVGASQKSFVLAGIEKVFLQLQTDGTESTMTIDVPHPASPKDLGMSPDDRQLGLGLVSLEVGSNIEN